MRLTSSAIESSSTLQVTRSYSNETACGLLVTGWAMMPDTSALGSLPNSVASPVSVSTAISAEVSRPRLSSMYRVRPSGSKYMAEVVMSSSGPMIIVDSHSPDSLSASQSDPPSGVDTRASLGARSWSTTMWAAPMSFSATRRESPVRTLILKRSWYCGSLRFMPIRASSGKRLEVPNGKALTPSKGVKSLVSPLSMLTA